MTSAVPDPSEMPLIELKSDPVLGLYACVPEGIAEELLEWFDEDGGSLIEVDAERSASLDQPGCRTFLFGTYHPAWVRDEMLECEMNVQLAPSVVMPEDTYEMPLSELLSLGEPSSGEEESEGLDYLALGISGEHVPELIRMALDEALHLGPGASNSVWGPVHAWRALGQLESQEAILPLLSLFRRIDEEEDDWVMTEMPAVIARIGTAAIDPVSDYLADPDHFEHARFCASSVLAQIAIAHPNARQECVARIGAQLARFSGQEESFNAFLICDLLDLQAVEAAEVIEKAFARKKVDKTIVGDWEDVQVHLGIKAKRSSARPKNLQTSLFAATENLIMEEAVEGDELFRDEPEDSEPLGAAPKIGRNDPCPCGSGKKFKKCCLG